MIVISFDAECVNQNTAPEIAALSRDERFCVGITGDMTEEQREILLAQHAPVRVGNERRLAPPLLLWSRLLPGDDKTTTLRKVHQRLPNASKFWHVEPSTRVGQVWSVTPSPNLGKVVDGWQHISLPTLGEKLAAA